MTKIPAHPDPMKEAIALKQAKALADARSDPFAHIDPNERREWAEFYRKRAAKGRRKSNKLQSSRYRSK